MIAADPEEESAALICEGVFMEIPFKKIEMNDRETIGGYFKQIGRAHV